jgi:hypothetical protein
MEDVINQAEPDAAPIVIELGERSRKRIRKLREGRGKLMAEIDQVLSDLRETGAVGVDAQIVVVVVKEKVESDFPRWFGCG